jgi:hypothetical protein
MNVRTVRDEMEEPEIPAGESRRLEEGQWLL